MNFSQYQRSFELEFTKTLYQNIDFSVFNTMKSNYDLIKSNSFYYNNKILKCFIQKNDLFIKKYDDSKKHSYVSFINDSTKYKSKPNYNLLEKSIEYGTYGIELEFYFDNTIKVTPILLHFKNDKRIKQQILHDGINFFKYTDRSETYWLLVRVAGQGNAIFKNINISKVGGE